MSGTYTRLVYHIVFSTKLRLPLIHDELKPDLYAYIGGIVRAEGGVLLEANGVEDHVHLLIRLKPTACVADCVRLLKANSSKWMNEEKMQWRKFAWQDGYSAFTVSRSQEPRVQAYIRNQVEHHRKCDYQSELLYLLEKHSVEYNEATLWQ